MIIIIILVMIVLQHIIVRTIIILNINFCDRLELLFWIDTASDKIMQANLDGSQPTAILDQQSHSCLSIK